MKTQNFCKLIFLIQTAEKVLQASQKCQKAESEKKALKRKFRCEIKIKWLMKNLH